MSTHADAGRMLAGWSAPDREQQARLAEFTAFVSTHPDATRRSCRAGHLTASGLLVDPHRQRVLLTLHRHVGRWLQLGGHCEPGDASLAAAARRELAEESGLAPASIDLDPWPTRLDRHHVQCRDGGGADGGGGGVTALDHLDVQYLASTDSSAPRRPTAEHTRWFGWDAPPSDADGAVLALIDAARIRWR